MLRWVDPQGVSRRSTVGWGILGAAEWPRWQQSLHLASAPPGPTRTPGYLDPAVEKHNVIFKVSSGMEVTTLQLKRLRNSPSLFQRLWRVASHPSFSSWCRLLLAPCPVWQDSIHTHSYHWDCASWYCKATPIPWGLHPLLDQCWYRTSLKPPWSNQWGLFINEMDFVISIKIDYKLLEVAPQQVSLSTGLT